MGTYSGKKKKKKREREREGERDREKTVNSRKKKSCRKTFHDDRDFVTTSKIVVFPLLVKHVLSLTASHR
jgi:hypothetical protein